MEATGCSPDELPAAACEEPPEIGASIALPWYKASAWGGLDPESSRLSCGTFLLDGAIREEGGTAAPSTGRWAPGSATHA